MAKLVYAANVSLDGYTEDDRGALDWATPDEEVFAFTTDLMRCAGTYIYGRKMYEAMAVWETDPVLAAQSDLTTVFANAWKAANKVVYSRTLIGVATANTQLERRFDAGVIRELKAAAASDVLVGGPNLAAQAFDAGLVDECHLFIWPVLLGGRKPALAVGRRSEVELVAERRFGNGVVHVRYRTSLPARAHLWPPE